MEIITSANILGTIILLALGVIGYLVRDKLSSMMDADSRLEGKIDKISEKMENIAGRVSRIEGSMKLSPLGAFSPIRR